MIKTYILTYKNQSTSASSLAFAFAKNHINPSIKHDLRQDFTHSTASTASIFILFLIFLNDNLHLYQLDLVV